MDDFSWSAFERTWTNAVVDSINAIREVAGLTVKQLRARLNVLGWPVSDATLAGILSGRKRGSISVAEVAAFARALNVSPTYLILGLPEHGALPPSPLWYGMPADAPRVASWLTGRALFLPFGGDNLDPESQTDEYFAEALARQGLDDVIAHDETMRAIDWQAALIVAASDFPEEQVSRALPSQVVEQEFLWDAISQLSSARRHQRTVYSDADRLSIPLPELPDVLAFIDVEPPVESDDLDLEALQSLTTPRQVANAKKRIQMALENISQMIPKDSRGQAADAAE